LAPKLRICLDSNFHDGFPVGVFSGPHSRERGAVGGTNAGHPDLRRLSKVLYYADDEVSMDGNQMEENTQAPTGLENQRSELIRLMESATPKAVLDAIDYVAALSANQPSQDLNFVTHSDGACYAGQE
jgi:hypothetical protein